MIGRFSMGKQVGTPSMSKKKFGTGAYAPAVVSRKFSKIQSPKIQAPKVRSAKVQPPKIKKGF